jgi:uncharacterized protein DUF6851/vanadium-dependent haloperoxidase-like protein
MNIDKYSDLRRPSLGLRVVLALHLVSACMAASNGVEASLIQHRAEPCNPSVAYTWIQIMLEASGRSVDRYGARPTIISREMAIPVTAMYDAWSAYDDMAAPTHPRAEWRRPRKERTQGNREVAIAYAMYRGLMYVYPEDAKWLTDEMRRLGHDPNNKSTELATPQGVGNAAAEAIIRYRQHDGANQHGDEIGGDGKPYSDYTFYEPRNPIDKIIDPDRWQPLPFENEKGEKYYPGFLTPHWYRVKPFALERSDQFRPPPFPKVGSEQLKQDVDECISYNATLTLEQKAIVEFMRDGPRSTGQSGHWLQFAEDVSRRDKHTLDQDVKLFFVIANTAFDAFIACWESKRHYDSSRPWTLIRHIYEGKKINGYLGPCKGFGEIPAEQWHAYSPAAFVTPPFPGYASGHSTVSGACSKMLELFTGSDQFGAYERRQAGELTEKGCDASKMQAQFGQPATGKDTSREIILKLPTFTAVAEMAGVSRIMGGYHIQADNIEGLKLGRAIAYYSWPKYQAYFAGKRP